jgi:pimeloyl-ACP methyl ester carboxylesterase
MLASQGINNFYIQYFQMPGVAEAEFERDVEYTFRSAFAASPGGISMFLKEGFGFLGDPAVERRLAPWISADEVAVFVENYRRTGFRGGLSWYRNFDRNWELTAPWQGAQIRQPSLFLAGSKDGVITGPMGQRRLAEMDKVVTDLRARIIIEGAGHWIQQERPQEVNEALVSFCKQVTAR